MKEINEYDEITRKENNMKSFSGIKLGKQENPKENQKIPNLFIIDNTFQVQGFELRTATWAVGITVPLFWL